MGAKSREALRFDPQTIGKVVLQDNLIKGAVVWGDDKFDTYEEFVQASDTIPQVEVRLPFLGEVAAA